MANHKRKYEQVSTGGEIMPAIASRDEAIQKLREYPPSLVREIEQQAGGAAAPQRLLELIQRRQQIESTQTAQESTI